jgi:tRNA(Ile)-lysidine synthase
MKSTPVSLPDFTAAMHRLGVAEQSPFIAVAVSGGGDSMALALLMRDWAAARNGKIVALTVDHGLRPGSGGEAREAGEILRAHGIEHRTLRWDGAKPETRIQEKARAARYDLLLEECRKMDCKILALAHNAEDQAETFWMRLAHGSGLDGLAGMAAMREAGDITIIRPVLSFPRAALRATCASYGVRWFEDPSNENEKFLRVRLRAFEDVLAAEGMTPERLARTVQKLAQARETLEFFAQKSFEECVMLKPEGATLDPALWREQPREIQSRVLAAALQAVRPQDYPPGAEALDALREAMLADDFAGRTLGGCEIFPHKKMIRLCPEAVAARAS